jgi:hypothetical protein
MSIAFAFVSDPTRPARVDAEFAETADALSAAGFRVWTYDAARARLVSRGEDTSGAVVVYRGWMMNAEDYAAFEASVSAAGATAFHSNDAYLAAHHAPRWVPLLRDLTPETVFLDEHADLTTALARLEWPGFVLKDWVKSLKTSRGSIFRDPSEAPAIVEEMRKFRGTIEGGLSVRRLEPLRPESERRYFALDGRAWAATGEVPAIVHEVCSRVSASRFFSIDIAEREDGVLRVVEIGDGQVSDIVGWTPERFGEMWAAHAAAASTPPERD